MSVGPDGSIYLPSISGTKIRKISPDGIIRTIAGTGVAGFSGDGGPALKAKLGSGNVHGAWAAADGSVIIADIGNKRVRMISPNGTISTIAGNGADLVSTSSPPYSFVGEGGPAVAMGIGQSLMATKGPDGAIYIVAGRVLKVASGFSGFTGDEIIVPSEGGSEVYRFDPLGRHLKTTDALTGVDTEVFGYDGAGRLASITDRSGNVTTISRDSAGNPTAITSPFGFVTTLGVDGNGYLNRITNPAGEATQVLCDGTGLLQTFTDPRGNTHIFTYDSLGRLKNDSNPAGGSKTLDRGDLGSGFWTSVTTALGRKSVYSVSTDANGSQQRVRTLPDGTAITQIESPTGMTTISYPDGTAVTETQTPDPRFGMVAPLLSTKVTTPSGLSHVVTNARKVTSSSSTPSTVVSIADTSTIDGQVYGTNYVAATRTQTMTSPAGRVTTVTLDAQGRPASIQAPGMAVASMYYYPNGRLHSTTQGTRTITYDYDAHGFLKTVTDPLLRVTTYGRDAAGRINSALLPGPRTVGYDHDQNGNTSSVTPPGRSAHGFDSTSIDQPWTYTPPSVPNAGLLITQYNYDVDGALWQVLLPDQNSIVSGYDPVGRLKTVTTARGTTGLGYDEVSRLHNISTPEGNGLVFGYDGSLVTSEQATGAVPGLVGRTFDNSFRVSSVSVNGGSLGIWGYDADSLLTSAGALGITREPATGRVSGTTVGSVTTAQHYSTYGELGDFSATAGGTALYSYSFPQRDDGGRIYTKSETIQGVTHSYVYTYDTAGRLWKVTRDGAQVEIYTYDDNGNRLGGTYDAQDRMTVYGSATYTYGPNGDLRTKTVGSQVTTYSYDATGNLMAAYLPNGKTISYVVDGRDRRVGKQVNGALVEGFLYDGQLRPVAWLDGTGAVKATFVYALHANVAEYMTTGGHTYRIIHDHLGSPRLVVDASSGAVAQRMEYDSYGQVLSDTSPGFQPFGFAGGLYDRDTGLVRFGARDYDPGTGRWTNKDPILLEGGLNVYEYCGGDPVNRLDPTGLLAGGDDLMLVAIVNNYIESGMLGGAGGIGAGTALSWAGGAGLAFGAGWLAGTWLNQDLEPYIQRGLDAIFGPADGRYTAQKFTPNQQIIVQWAKEYQNSGVDQDDAEALVDLGNQAGLPCRGPEQHPNRPRGKDPHIHVGPIPHIFIRQMP
jgi:RHS repeat-associated protein